MSAIKRGRCLAFLTALVLVLMLALPAGASKLIQDPSQQDLSFAISGPDVAGDAGVLYSPPQEAGPDAGLGALAYADPEAGSGLQALTAYNQSLSDPVSGAAAGSGAYNATTYWWYFYTGRYRVLVPGNSKGPYSSYLSTARAITPYLDPAYYDAAGVLGRGTSYYISLWMQYDSGNGASGWYRPGINSYSIYLNFAHIGSASSAGRTTSHETNHLLFDHAANLYRRYGAGSSWLLEALAYYTGNSAYRYGPHYSYSYNSARLRSYSANGAKKASWYDSGVRYMRGGWTGLDYVQLNTIGYFLAHSNRGIRAVHDTVNSLAGGAGIDSAFSRAYGGLTSGQHSTQSGPGVGTLYSYYINYYLGHY